MKEKSALESESDQSLKGRSAATAIAYCPEFGIYHYLRVDGEEAYFDDLRLEAVVQSHLSAGETVQAEFLATLTGFARQFPHKIVTFDAEGKFGYRDPPKRVDQAEDDGEQDGK